MLSNPFSDFPGEDIRGSTLLFLEYFLFLCSTIERIDNLTIYVGSNFVRKSVASFLLFGDQDDGRRFLIRRFPTRNHREGTNPMIRPPPTHASPEARIHRHHKGKYFPSFR